MTIAHRPHRTALAPAAVAIAAALALCTPAAYAQDKPVQLKLSS